MNRGALILALALGAISLALWLARPQTASAPEPAPRITIDAYPLYPGIEWRKSLAEEVTIGTTTYVGASVSSLPISDTMDPGGIFTPFEQYYAGLLAERGYHVVNELAAGGHVGGQTGYTNGATVVLTRFQIDYKTRPENAPSECPCDVTLSIFSSPPNAD